MCWKDLTMLKILNTIEVETLPGSNIKETVREMHFLAVKYEATVHCVFNGRDVFVNDTSDIELVLNKYFVYQV